MDGTGNSRLSPRAAVDAAAGYNGAKKSSPRSLETTISDEHGQTRPVTLADGNGTKESLLSYARHARHKSCPRIAHLFETVYECVVDSHS